MAFLVQVQGPKSIAEPKYCHNWTSSKECAKQMANLYGYPVDIRAVQDDIACLTIEPSDVIKPGDVF
jgi:hypothetical protein